MFFILAFLRRGRAAGTPDRSTELTPPASGEPRASDAPAASELLPIDRAMQRYADGDGAAFAEVFAGLAPRLTLFLRRLGCTLDLAEDLTQETFLRMHHARGSFARDKPVTPWAYSIARNCFISHARSAKTRRVRASVDADTVGSLAEQGVSSVEEESIARQSAAVVQRALASMTEARREAFVLLRYEGLSVAAAAQIVGISEGALKIRAFHAYQVLRQALADMDAPSAPSARMGAELATDG